MLIHLADALSGKTGTEHKKVPLESNHLQKSGFYGDKIQYALASDNSFADFMITYQESHKVSIGANLNLICKAPCSRCLEPVEIPLNLEIKREIDFHQTEEERRASLDEMSFIHEFDLDTEALIQEEIMLNIPIQILCKEDCKGLCPQCGINRNKDNCNCDEAPKDPRMMAISELFRQSVLENLE